MANATSIVKKGVVRRSDEFIKRSVETLTAETRFYPHAFIGVDLTGYYCKGDDTQAWLFAGVVRGDQGAPLLPIGTAGDILLELGIQQPWRMEVAIASVAVTDIGKKVYAVDDQTGTLANTGVFSNFIGHVVDVVTTNIALVELCYEGIAANAKYHVTRTMAATGAISVTKWDLGKTILLPNTGAQTLTLPLVADTQAGDTLTFIKTSADAAAVTLDGAGAETIDGAATLATVDAQYDTVQIVSTGTAWVVTYRDIT